MTKHLGSLVFAFAALIAANVHAQVAVVPSVNHEQLPASPDARLAANKRLVYDFWREVFEAGHMELAEKYMAEGYIQHNPNVPTGRAAFIDFFSENVSAGAIQPRVKAPLLAIPADGDLVVLVFAREGPDPKDPSKRYTTSWFDMFRLEGGKIAEHWDRGRRGTNTMAAGPMFAKTPNLSLDRTARRQRLRSYPTIFVASTGLEGLTWRRIG